MDQSVFHRRRLLKLGIISMLVRDLERKIALEENHPQYCTVQQEAIYYTVYYFHMDTVKSYGGLGFIFSATMTEPGLRQPYNINY